ncbi:hypothetical protein [Arthrobacter bambusae]|uniref:Histidine kinase N-terminal 7TM region domain-containing protein n=1 Tax=Arthrobacter bambusae TaxID=1338426 RepID=A0AAW8DCL7_9MICC|nr:hypothetical protein [Arthrobacter bambusae]MDP9906082.1 hypothetical protein [Arthrobacter bambusae]MDQ0131123.1 hypothetical protein [Arthrobacter bambusae]MDQ0181885.1 hypothetical protein [Arthrobacter bambusae]
MIQAIAASVIWGLVLCLLPGSRTRKDHSILFAAIAIATALSLNVDPIFIAGDQALGGRNLLDLSANILMVVGIYFLSQAIVRAAEIKDAPVRRGRRGLLILGLVSAGLVLAFLRIEAPVSSTRFMLDYGDQPAAAVYSAIQFVYIGVVVGVTGYVCVRFRRRMVTSYFRVAFALIGIGCSLALVLVFAVLGMDVAHLLRQQSTMEQLAAVYDTSFVGAMVFLCAGLALPPVARRIVRRAQLRTQAGLLENLRSTWEKATATRKDGRLAAPAAAIQPSDPETRRLHRMLVEIEDALLMDPATAKLLDETDFQTLSRTEDYLASNQDPQDFRAGLGRWGRTKDPSDR